MSKKHSMTFEGECNSCGATGLYKGFAEGEGAAVVCKSCKGTGKVKQTVTWTEFEKRKTKKNIEWVYESNPGIGLGKNEEKGIDYSYCGGMSYSDWKKGKKFSKEHQPRKVVCPAWYFQGVDYKRKPNWKECPGFGAFTDCSHFKRKDQCWIRHDKEKL